MKPSILILIFCLFSLIPSLGSYSETTKSSEVVEANPLKIIIVNGQVLSKPAELDYTYNLKLTELTQNNNLLINAQNINADKEDKSVMQKIFGKKCKRHHKI